MATRECSVKTMLHASLLASTITTIAVHAHHLKTRPEVGKTRKVAPLHPMQVARVFARFAELIALAMEMDEAGQREKATDAWDWLAQSINRKAEDPNWRRRPSTLDILRGTKQSPPRKVAKRASHAKAILK